MGWINLEIFSEELRQKKSPLDYFLEVSTQLKLSLGIELVHHGSDEIKISNLS